MEKDEWEKVIEKDGGEERGKKGREMRKMIKN
jgi:hypothetical protein